MSKFWSVAAAAVIGCLIGLMVNRLRGRRRIHRFRGQPYWAALAIVARVRRQQENMEKGWPSVELEVLDDELTEVVVLPPQPRPYLEPLLPAPHEITRAQGGLPSKTYPFP
ncbi:hypothetical protein [Amycolatopsis lurida]|uniref:hypothetical protein n=1 Tax=Amycolatopsis lurida TaxID=31959 RepID=UPI000ACB4DAE|nr:hypothetical protein [Amycolatopsis lurida]